MEVWRYWDCTSDSADPLQNGEWEEEKRGDVPDKAMDNES